MRAPVGSTQKKYRKNRGPSAHFRDLWPPTPRTARSYPTLLVSPDLGRDQSLRKINKPKFEKNQSLRFTNRSLRSLRQETRKFEQNEAQSLINPAKTHTNTVLWKSQSSRSEKSINPEKTHTNTVLWKSQSSRSKFEIARSLSRVISGFMSCYVVLTFSLSLGFCSLVICATKKRGELYPPEG